MCCNLPAYEAPEAFTCSLSSEEALPLDAKEDVAATAVLLSLFTRKQSIDMFFDAMHTWSGESYIPETTTTWQEST